MPWVVPRLAAWAFITFVKVYLMPRLKQHRQQAAGMQDHIYGMLAMLSTRLELKVLWQKQQDGQLTQKLSSLT